MPTRLCAAFLFASTYLVSTCHKSHQPDPAATSKQNFEFLALVYSETFGRRFQLPALGVYPLDPGLQAVAVRVATEPGWGTFCYLDDSIAFAYPAGTAGRWLDSATSGVMFFAEHLNEKALTIQRERWTQNIALVRAVFLDVKPRQG
jgi:hypothetical protein